MKVLLIFVSFLAFIWVMGIVYLLTGVGKIFFHDVLGWHKPDEKESYDGCSVHSHCKYCGQEIMQDSQGNWF